MKWTNLEKVMQDYKDFVAEAVKSNMPDYYQLKKDITFNLQINDTLFEISFKAKTYWYYANYGRKSGKFPPASAIDSWITRRKITPYPLPSGRIPTRDQLVFLISRKIAEKGFEGSGFLQKGLKEQEDYWESRISNAITEDIEAEIMTWLSPLKGHTII